MHNFNNSNAVTKIRLSSNNFAINTTKWYNFQEDKNLQKLRKKEIESEIHMVFICNKCNIRREAFNNINEVDNIKLQIGNQVEKLKFFVS